MELKEFIKETISNICEGVRESKEELDKKGIAVAPGLRPLPNLS